MSIGQDLSVVVPVFNERDNIRPLAQALRKALEETGLRWEVIFVDDGSEDGSTEIIRAQSEEDSRFRILRLDSNHGQSAAWDAGFRHTRGALVATLDADLQNDPADLPEMIRKLDDPDHPADVVCGIRVGRKDTLGRKIQSRIGNGIRTWMTGRTVQDTGCSLRVMRATFLEGLTLYDGLHRFLPTLLAWRGARIVEVPVRHHPRAAGESKYGLWNRALRGAWDLIAVRWLRSRRLEYRVVEGAE